MVPECVHADEEAGFVGRHCGAWVEEGEEAGGDFALEEAEVGGRDGAAGEGLCLWGLDDVCGFGGLRRLLVAFQHGLVR